MREENFGQRQTKTHERKGWERIGGYIVLMGPKGEKMLLRSISEIS
jgi:hypothetical protein